MKRLLLFLAAALVAGVTTVRAGSAEALDVYSVQITGKMTVSTGTSDFETKPFDNASILAAVSGTIGIPAANLQLVLLTSTANPVSASVYVARKNGELLENGGVIQIQLATPLVKDVAGPQDLIRSAIQISMEVPNRIDSATGYGSGKATVRFGPPVKVASHNFRFFALGTAVPSATVLVEGKLVAGGKVPFSLPPP